MYDNDISQFLLSAYDLGMVNGEYVFIALDAAEGNRNRSLFYKLFCAINNHFRDSVYNLRIYLSLLAYSDE